MKLKTFFSFFIMGISLALTLFFATPQICNKILPSLLAGTEFEGQKIHLNYISPWKLIGNVELEKDGLIIDLPRFEIHYTPQGLIKKQLNEVLIDGLYLHINTENFRNSSAKSDNAPSPLPLRFPVTINTISIKNSHASIQGIAPQDLSVTLNSTFSLQTTQEQDGYHFTQLQGQLDSRGDVEGNLAFSVKKDANKLNLSANFHLPITPLSQVFSLGDVQGSLTGRFQGYTDKNLNSLHDYSANFTANNFSFSSPSLHLKTLRAIRFVLNGDDADLSYSARSTVLINSHKLNTQLQGQLNLNTFRGGATAQFQQAANTLRAQFNHRGFENLSGSFTSQALQYQDIRGQGFAGSITANQHDGNIQVKTRLTAKSLQPNKDTFIHGAEIKKSFYLNAAKELRGSGKFFVQKMTYLGEPLSKVTGTTLMDSKAITIQGSIQPLFTENLQLPYRASYTFATGIMEGKCTVDQTTLSHQKLPLFIQKQYPENISFSAGVKADINFRYDKQLHASALFELHNGKASLGTELNIQGVNTTIQIPNLLLAKSLPSQKLTIDTITFNKIDLSDIKVAFRLENYNTLFLEKSSFKWCNGRVESNSLMLSPENTTFQITLYCDRIGFSQLLGQLGIPGAEGTGSLNGRLPISYNQGKLFFDDGFLFSSPGDTGIIKFTNTETLTQSLGENIGAAHLEYSMRAIENFQYNWTTLSFNSKGEDLTVAMKLDGKPAIPLPYAYKNGMMVRSNTGPGMQHPVNFNVNFHLPLTEILRYGANIQSLMEKM